MTTALLFLFAVAALACFLAWQCARADLAESEAECRRSRNLAEAWQLEADALRDYWMQEKVLHRRCRVRAEEAERRLHELSVGAWAGRNWHRPGGIGRVKAWLPMDHYKIDHLSGGIKGSTKPLSCSPPMNLQIRKSRPR